MKKSQHTLQRHSTVSIVIPVYNEAEALESCLAAIAAQTVRPYEVIVVDNNSTDESALVAARFPFVTILHEPRQGVVYARDKGFNAASGAIIGRIDADTRIAPDWVATVQALFADTQIVATSGRMRYGDIAFERTVNGIEAVVRAWLARRMRRAMFLQGANMALRHSGWQKVKPLLCYDADMHEDFDLALHLQQLSLGRVTYTPALEATISARRLGSGFFSFCVYAWLNPKTYALHGVWQRVYMYPVVIAVIILYGLLGAFYKAYDPRLGRARLGRIFESEQQARRVNPATFRE